MQQKTLCLLLKEGSTSEVLLGFKKVRFGAGKYTGIGGRVETGERIISAAIREMEEETGIEVMEKDIQRVGQLTFLFPAKPSWKQVVHVFLTKIWVGDPIEGEEVIPIWFPIDQIPYENMWQDAVHWLPRILGGERIDARFTFKTDNETLDVVEMEPLDVREIE
jgi:8-oxo-dGTP diphosphatase